jgi:hypothetical protein
MADASDLESDDLRVMGVQVPLGALTETGLSFNGRTLALQAGNEGSIPSDSTRFGVEVVMPYFESHVTIEPVFEARLEEFKILCARFGFKPAKLLMQKRAVDTPERSKSDTFCTGHSKTYADLEKRMLGLLIVLQAEGFKIWRYKIEDCILDSRGDDSLFPLC